MKVLIVSHNSFSHTVNMGKTLLSYFGDFKPEEISQFYIHSEIPTVDTVCTSYFRFTDKDAIKSLFRMKERGQIFEKADVQTDRIYNRTDAGIVASLYQKGTRRTSLIYLLRCVLWSLAQWKTKGLKKWLDEKKPDVVFFASSDYIFMYQIAMYIADYCDVPLVVACVDDYYIHNANSNDVGGWIYHKLYRRVVRQAMNRAESILTICDSMNAAYRGIFEKTCYTLHTSVVSKQLPFCESPYRISYVGNLDFKRYKQLIDIADTLYRVTSGKCVLDIYTAETKPEIINQLKNAVGIRFNGKISADQVLKVMSESVLVIHTESFEADVIEQVRYSVSTKIAESLMYAPCLLAFGPEEVASIDYLRKHKAAYVITTKAELESVWRKYWLTSSCVR